MAMSIANHADSHHVLPPVAQLFQCCTKATCPAAPLHRKSNAVTDNQAIASLQIQLEVDVAKSGTIASYRGTGRALTSPSPPLSGPVSPRALQAAGDLPLSYSNRAAADARS